MSNSDKLENEGSGRKRDMTVGEGEREEILFDYILRARLEGAFVSPCGTEGARWEGAFVSPCGTEGARWEGFPEWPEEFPYDAF